MLGKVPSISLLTMVCSILNATKVNLFSPFWLSHTSDSSSKFRSIDSDSSL